MTAHVHDRGCGSKSMSFLLHCSTSKATGVFHLFLLHHMSTMHMQRTVWVKPRDYTDSLVHPLCQQTLISLSL